MKIQGLILSLAVVFMGFQAQTWAAKSGAPSSISCSNYQNMKEAIKAIVITGKGAIDDKTSNSDDLKGLVGYAKTIDDTYRSGCQ